MFSRLIIYILTALALSLVCGCSLEAEGEPTDAGASDAGDTAAPEDTADDAEADADQPVAVGEPCEGPAACVAGAACIGTDDPEVYVCMAECSQAGRICADGSVCTALLAGDRPVCYIGGSTEGGLSCETNLDCTPGTLCFGTDTEAYCLPACHRDDPVCEAGAYCRYGSSGKGYCRQAFGDGCSSEGFCQLGWTCSERIDELAGVLDGGLCTAECTSDADCEQGVCRTVPSTSVAVCVETCQTDGDCRFNQGWRCIDAARCQQADDPAACESLRDGQNLCLPDGLVGPA